jgi:hypothetical protein
VLVSQLAGTRRRQILQLLNDNGPLSAALIAEVARPRISVRDVRKVIRRLIKKEILSVHHESTTRTAGRFFIISHDKLAREQIAKWLCLNAEDLRQPKFFGKEQEHTAKCALWSAYLKDEFGDAEIVRDLQLIKQRLYSGTRENVEDLRELVPDIVLNFSGELVRETVSIGFEIERTRKSAKRLVRKLSKVVNQSVLDGVVYICETGGIRDSIATVLSENRLLSSERIKHYGSAFILFTDKTLVSKNSQPYLVNIEGKTVTLKDWVSALLKISTDYRRASHFWKPEIAEPNGAANEKSNCIGTIREI